MINKLIEKYKTKIRIGEEAKTQAKKVGSAKTVIKYNFREDIYREILKDLNQLKKSQLQNLNEVKAYLHSQKVTPEMVAIAMRKIEISILGVIIDE